MNTRQIVATGAFDRLQAREVRFLEEASRLGELTVLLWSDDLVRRLSDSPPKFPDTERRYCLDAIRFVELPEITGLKPDIWVMQPLDHNVIKEAFCRKHGLDFHVINE
jgi:glycerol-3-phosphate cytidylyltransferase-like family protein